jgi:hypothetical protein
MRLDTCAHRAGYDYMSICSALTDPKSEPAQLILRQTELA